MMKTAYKMNWRNAASLITLAKRNGALSDSNGGGFNYDVLLQTRTSTGSFANSLVFPGGVCEEADAAPEWVRVLKSFGYTDQHFNNLHFRESHVTPLFQDNPILRHISLRITAIRETFEELGLLICRSNAVNKKSDIWANNISNINIKLWQTRVSKNPQDFLTLCQEHNCYPDIFSLYYWSNWLTPTVFKKRFNTAFFVTVLQEKPDFIPGSTEVAGVQWNTPAETLQLHKEKKVDLPYPQLYELTRLEHIKYIEEVGIFAQGRSCHGVDLFFPIVVNAKDGKLHLLPGDDLYPSDLDFGSTQGVQELNQTVAELRKTSHVIHRYERTDNKIQFILKNYRPRDHIIMGDKVIDIVE